MFVLFFVFVQKMSLALDRKCYVHGLTENAGPENAGPQKQDGKMEDKLPKAIT